MMFRFAVAIVTLSVGALVGVIAAHSPVFNGADLAFLICLSSFLWAVWPALHKDFWVDDDPKLARLDDEVDRFEHTGRFRD